MKEVVEALTRLAIDRTKNPYLRFIIKKTSKQLKIKAYKELLVELFIHSEGKNILVLKVQQPVNTSGIEGSKIWDLIRPVFIYEILKWAMSEEGKEIIDGYKME